MGAGGMKRPGGAQSPRQGGAPMLQNAMQRQQQRQQQPPMMQTQQMPMQQPPMLQTQQMPQQMPQDPMQQGAAGGKGGMPGAQNPMMQGQIPQNPMQQNPYMQQMMSKQGGPMPMGQQGAAGGKGGMPGAGPAPNAMQQFSQQQGLAGLMQPQQSSTNSLQ